MTSFDVGHLYWLDIVDGGELILVSTQLKAHKNAVIAAVSDAYSAHVATACLSGVVQVWNTDSSMYVCSMF